MTRRVPNPTPLAQRGQGPKRRYGASRLNLVLGETLTVFHRSPTGAPRDIYEVTVIAPGDRYPLFRIQLADGDTLEVCRLPKLAGE